MRAASQGERVAGQAEGETALGEEETGQHGADTSQGDADADAVPFGVASTVEDAPEVDLGGGLGGDVGGDVGDDVGEGGAEVAAASDTAVALVPPPAILDSAHDFLASPGLTSYLSNHSISQAPHTVSLRLEARASA